jgi:hypothetical protein
MLPSNSNAKLEAQDTLIFSDQEYQEMRLQLTSDFQYPIDSVPVEFNDPLSDQYDIRSYQEISHNKLASAKKSFVGMEGRIKILKVNNEEGNQKEVILYFKDGKLHQHIQSIDPQNFGMVEKVAKDIDFYIKLAQKLIELGIGNKSLRETKQLFLKNSKEKKSETLDSYKKLKSEVIKILRSNSSNQEINGFIQSFSSQDNGKKYLDSANIVVAQQFMRSVALRKQISASQSSVASGGGLLNLASDPLERAKVTGRGITVDYDTQKPTQITVKRYNYDQPEQISPVSNVVYIKIKKLTERGELASSGQKKFSLSGQNQFCFLKISFDASGKPKIDTDNVYVTDRAGQKPITKISLTTIEQSNRADSALLISSLKQMTINVENYHIDQDMSVSKVQENFTKKDFFEKSSAQKIQKVLRGHLGRKNVRQAQLARVEDQEKENARSKIGHAVWRKIVQRNTNELITKKAKDDAALKLQAAVRQVAVRQAEQARQVQAEQARQAEQAKVEAAIKIQAVARGHNARVEARKDEQARQVQAEQARQAQAELARQAEEARQVEVARARQAEQAKQAEQARRAQASRSRTKFQQSAKQVRPDLSAQVDTRFSELPNFLQKLYNSQDSFTNDTQGQQAIFRFHESALTPSAELSESINSLISLLVQEKAESFKSVLRDYLSNRDCIYQLSPSQKKSLIDGVLTRSDTATSLHLSEQQSLSQSVVYEARPEIGGRADGSDVLENWEDRLDDITSQRLSQGVLSRKVAITNETFASGQKESLKSNNPTRSTKIDELFAKIYQSLPIGNRDETFKSEEYKMAMGELLNICNQKKSRSLIEQIKSSLTTSESDKYNLRDEDRAWIRIFPIDECKKAYEDKLSTEQEAIRRAEQAELARAEQARAEQARAEQARAEQARQARQAQAQAELARQAQAEAQAEQARQAEAEQARQAEAAIKIQKVARGYIVRSKAQESNESVYDSDSDADSFIGDHSEDEGDDDLRDKPLYGVGQSGFDSRSSSFFGFGGASLLKTSSIGTTNNQLYIANLSARLASPKESVNQGQQIPPNPETSPRLGGSQTLSQNGSGQRDA